jgi:ABC-type multidrug transport system ATPase subunit
LLEEADQLCRGVAFIVNRRIVANDTLENLKLAYRKRSLDITLAGLKVDSNLTHGILKMDDPADQ